MNKIDKIFIDLNEEIEYYRYGRIHMVDFSLLLNNSQTGRLKDKYKNLLTTFINSNEKILRSYEEEIILKKLKKFVVKNPNNSEHLNSLIDFLKDTNLKEYLIEKNNMFYEEVEKSDEFNNYVSKIQKEFEILGEKINQVKKYSDEVEYELSYELENYNAQKSFESFLIDMHEKCNYPYIQNSISGGTFYNALTKEINYMQEETIKVNPKLTKKEINFLCTEAQKNNINLLKDIKELKKIGISREDIENNIPLIGDVGTEKLINNSYQIHNKQERSINQNIESDYYNCLGGFENIDMLYHNICKQDQTQDNQLLEFQKNDLLINMGRVCELALKYIILQELKKNNPNLNEDQYNRFFTKKGFVLDFLKKQNVGHEEIKTIETYNDLNRQNSHNFHYLFLIFNLGLKDNYIEFEKILKYNIISNYFCKKEKNSKYILFPGKLKYSQSMQLKNLIDDEIGQKIQEIVNHGDIFTALRYANNNHKEKNYNITSVYEYTKYLILFAKLVHDNQNDNQHIEKNFANIKLIENHHLFNISKEEAVMINNFNLDIYSLELILLENDVRDVIYLLNNGLSLNKILDIICYLSSKEAIKLFNQNRLDNYLTDVYNEIDYLDNNISAYTDEDQYNALKNEEEIKNLYTPKSK